METNTQENFKTMKLVNSTSQKGTPSFRLVPMSLRSPYCMGEYILEESKLVLVLKEKIRTLKTIPKLNSDGSFVKLPKPIVDGPTVAVYRVELEENLEIFITDIESIDSFIQDIATNATTFKYQQFLAKIDLNPPKPKLITTLA